MYITTQINSAEACVNAFYDDLERPKDIGIALKSMCYEPSHVCNWNNFVTTLLKQVLYAVTTVLSAVIL